MTLMRDKSGRSGRRRGSQKPGTRTPGSPPPSCARARPVSSRDAVTTMQPAATTSWQTIFKRLFTGYAGTMISDYSCSGVLGTAGRLRLIDEPVEAVPWHRLHYRAIGAFSGKVDFRFSAENATTQEARARRLTAHA